MSRMRSIRHSSHAMLPHCNESLMKMDGAHVFPITVCHASMASYIGYARQASTLANRALTSRFRCIPKCLGSLPTRSPFHFANSIKGIARSLRPRPIRDGAAQHRKSGPQDERGKFAPFASACAGQAHRKANHFFPFQCRSRLYRRTRRAHHLSGIRPCRDYAKGHG